MGGKGNNSSQMPAYMPDDNSDEQMMQMMSTMMSGMMNTMAVMSQASSNMQPPSLPAFPTVPTMAQIDWTDQNQKLSEKAKADYQAERARKFGRMDTVLTSPLLDEEEPTVLKSLLAGE